MSAQERLLSAVGAAISMLFILAISKGLCGLEGASMLITSMAATSVLLFAVPHGPLSQPWPVFGGNVISATIGVTCAQWIPHEILGGAVAVGLSIWVMLLCKCLHPAAASTAFTAVMGGSAIRALGYHYVLCPVALNSISILFIAFLFNAPFPARRYPAAWVSRAKSKDEVAHEEVEAALRELGTYVDITEDDLLRLHQLLSKKRKPRQRAEVSRYAEAKDTLIK